MTAVTLMPDVWDSGVLVAKDVGGGHLQDQNGVCIRCLLCNDSECCDRPTECTHSDGAADGR